MNSPIRVKIYNREGWLLKCDDGSKKGVFAYHDIGFTKKDNRPFSKIWFCDVFESDPKKIDGKEHEVFNFNRVSAGTKFFNKIGVNPNQLPVLIKLATILYNEIAGTNVSTPALPDPMNKPTEEDELYNMVMGHPKF
jgi:hypothetical protein